MATSGETPLSADLPPEVRDRLAGLLSDIEDCIGDSAMYRIEKLILSAFESESRLRLQAEKDRDELAGYSRDVAMLLDRAGIGSSQSPNSVRVGLALERHLEIGEELDKEAAQRDKNAIDLARCNIAREAAEKELAESNAVCVCGCPESAHESYGEDGDSCEDDTHECMRTSKAVYAIVHQLRERALQAEKERDALRDWQATVTVALGREQGAFYEDVPRHIREMRDALAAHREIAKEMREFIRSWDTPKEIAQWADQLDPPVHEET
jgi:hypothetical protein